MSEAVPGLPDVVDDSDDFPELPPAPEVDWSWAHEEPEEETPELSAEQVAAILVVHNAEEWLARTLVALGRLDERPGVVIAVDNGSTDASRALLEKAADEELIDEVVEGTATEGFGEAVARAVARLNPDTTWLWLLHDDAEPRRTALTELLLRAGREPRPDIVVPALMSPRMRNHPDRVIEAGRTLTPSGRRVSAADTGDIDQNQLDGAPVLGGSTAGLFVSRAAHEQLGGLDPQIPLFHDGTDLGWRAHRAGLSVVSEPKAALYHRQMGRHGERDSALIGSDPVATERALGMRVVAAHSARPRWRRLVMALSCLFAGLGLLVGKAPRSALAEWRAGARILTDRAVPDLAQQRQGLTGQVGPQLLPTRRQGLVRVADQVGTAFNERYHDYREDHDEISIDELTGDEYTGPQSRVHIASPALALMGVMAVLALLASRRWWGMGELTGPALNPAPRTLGQAFAGWLEAPVSLPGTHAPWLGWAAVGSAITGGSPEAFARTLTIVTPLLAAWSFLGFARWVMGRRARGWMVPLLSVWYGLGLVLLGVVNSGSLGSMVLGVVAPRIALAIARWFGTDPERGRVDGWRAPAAFALWTALAASAHPVLALLAPVVALAHLVRRGPRWSQLLAALGPAALLAGWWPRLLHEWPRLLTGADPLVARVGEVPGALAAMIGGGGHLAWAAGASLAVAALLALALVVRGLERNSVMPAVALVIAVLALAAAVVLPKFVLTLDGLPARPAASPWLILAWLALMSAVVLSPADVEGRPRARGRVTAVVALGCLGASVLWVQGARTADLRVTTTALPAHVTALQQNGPARALMVEQDGGSVRWSLVSDRRPVWGTGEQNPATTSADADQLAALVQEVVSGSPGADLANRLQASGITHLWLRGGSLDQAAAVTNVAGMVPGTVDDRTKVWTVRGDGTTWQAPATRSTLGWGVWQGIGLLVLVLLSAPSVASAQTGPRRALEASR